MINLFVDARSILAFAIPFALIIIVGSLASCYMKKKAGNKTFERTSNKGEDIDAVAMSACVISMREARSSSETLYFVEFKTEEGELFEYEVPAEVYKSVGVGQVSTLVTFEDKFIAFEEGEEI
jgi:hypothetical protein